MRNGSTASPRDNCSHCSVIDTDISAPPTVRERPCDLLRSLSIDKTSTPLQAILLSLAGEGDSFLGDPVEGTELVPILQRLPIFRVAVVLGLLVPSVVTAQMSAPLPPPQNLSEPRELIDSIDPGAFELIVTPNRHWLPVTSQESARKFWARSGSHVLTSGGLILEDEVFGANLELLSDIVGWFRVGVGVTAAAADSSEDAVGADDAAPSVQEAATRLANTGGVVHVTGHLPLLYRRHDEFQSTWTALLSVSAGMEAPKTGEFLENPAVTAQTGMELFYRRGGVEKRIDFELGLNARGYWFNNTYADKASIDNNLGFLIAPRVGLVLLGNTRLNLLWRPLRTDVFDSLGELAVSLQQTRN